LNPYDGRVLFELDQLYNKLNRQPAERLAFLEQHKELVEQRDDLTIERITLLNLLHRPDDARQLLTKHSFHPWEGGEGKVTRQYVLSLVELARRCIGGGEFSTAVHHLQQAQLYPTNLGEGKLYGAQENNIFYFLGYAYAGLGETDRAQEWYGRAAVGLSEPSSAVFYNDQPPDMIFYQGLACQKLGNLAEAQELFQKLIDYGRDHMNDEVKIDYFAISLPNFLVFEEDLGRRNQVHCHYMIALGHIGLKEYAVAKVHFNEVRKMDANHLGTVLHQQLLQPEQA
jgi:tetratricopeptide (TPR) repeat protein